MNRKAAEFFYLSDGKRKLKEIIKFMYPEVEFSFIFENFFPFLNEAIKSGDVLVSSSPVKRKRNITGSFNHFYPMHIVLELTYACNLKCSHCYAYSPQKSGYISFDELRDFLLFLKKNGCRIAELTGGEPLLHPEFNRILEFCSENFDYVCVLTNGTMITPENARIFEKNKDKILVNISLDGPSPSIHDLKRGVKGAFEKTLSAIKILSSRGLFVRVSMTVYPDTVKYIEDALILSIKYGAKSFVWSPVLPFGKGKDVKWDGEKAKEMFEIENKIVVKYKNFIQTIERDFMENMMSFQNCGAGWRSFVLTPEGFLKPCVFVSQKECNFGRINKDKFEEIFKKEILAKFYSLPSPERKICGECKNLYYCEFCWARAVSRAKENKNCRWREKTQIDELIRI